MDFMQCLPLNAERSKAVFDSCSKYVKVKECYINVYRVACTFFENMRFGEWRVAYGYMTSSIGLLIRHCFLIDENNAVIDPTLFAQDTVDDDRSYYVMKVYDTFSEYLNAVEKEDNYPALSRTLRPYDERAHTWGRENSFYLCG